MSDLRNKYVPPAINETAFNCPHCGAFAKQNWLHTYAHYYRKDDKPPILRETDLTDLDLSHIEDEDKRVEMRKDAGSLASGRPSLITRNGYPDWSIANLSLARCFNCNEHSVWIYDRMLWPMRGPAPAANADLPPSVRDDYDEASLILDLSPRGAAALLRLCIQKICKHLGEEGKNINGDIAELVKKGLHIHVQQALDIVRVVGNNAVHPGQMDIRDDRQTAEKLFGLVNLITEITISQPKHVEEMYTSSVPEELREAIAKRDGK